ncbi:MAG: alpha/beta hydrolase [Alphaproteobacteria bacterium]|nr:alpha/beta hydrolase [Alphaproteobacteria bacterium]
MSIFERADAKLLPGFQRHPVEIDGKSVMTLIAGKGPPLLMLHGDPQTHLCWHHLAPALATKFTVVLTDIRGRGETHKPRYIEGQNAYTKREMAAEQLSVMHALGHETFSLVGHDRGARVARRLALDYPEAVAQLVVMDVIPALDFYENTNAEIAQDYFYFSFLTQTYPIPDRLISAGPEAFLKLILHGLSDQPVHYHELALEAYLAANTGSDAVTAMCECFRAGYHIDQLHDAADRAAYRKIICPTLVMWGERGVVDKHFDVQQIWHGWCEQPQFSAMPSGHFIPEEAPDEALAALNNFLVVQN